MVLSAYDTMIVLLRYNTKPAINESTSSHSLSYQNRNLFLWFLRVMIPGCVERTVRVVTNVTTLYKG